MVYNYTMTDPQKLHVVRVAFGNCSSSRQMQHDIQHAIDIDNGGAWDEWGGVTWFVMGQTNADLLRKMGVKSAFNLVDKNLFVHDPSVSFWYNKTMLVLEAFKTFGMSSRVLYVDCDVNITKKPDSRMATLLSSSLTDSRRFIAPVRRCVRRKRMPFATIDRRELRICPCNCLMYCKDGKVFEEMLPLYAEIASKYGSPKVTHWTGTETTVWDDETVAMYWFDKANGFKTTPEIVGAMEPESVIRLQRHPPTESSAMKVQEDLYLVHH